jgi:hypothetical protein
MLQNEQSPKGPGTKQQAAAFLVVDLCLWVTSVTCFSLGVGVRVSTCLSFWNQLLPESSPSCTGAKPTCMVPTRMCQSGNMAKSNIYEAEESLCSFCGLHFNHMAQVWQCNSVPREDLSPMSWSSSGQWAPGPLWATPSLTIFSVPWQELSEFNATAIKSPTNTATVQGLKAGAIYVFQVRARTVAGYGRYSGKMYFQTMTEGEQNPWGRRRARAPQTEQIQGRIPTEPLCDLETAHTPFLLDGSVPSLLGRILCTVQTSQPERSQTLPMPSYQPGLFLSQATGELRPNLQGHSEQVTSIPCSRFFSSTK